MRIATVNFYFFISNTKTHILPEYNGIKLVHRGNKSHFQKIRQHYQNLKQNKHNKYYLYHPQPIDIGLEMLKRDIQIITYITRHNYQTVEAIKIQNANQNQGKIGQLIGQKLKLFLQTHRFEIHNSFLDLHPCDSYHKICSYMGATKDKQVADIFSTCKFNEKKLNNNVIILPYLKKLRQLYLDTKQLKLRKLNRIRTASKQQQKQAIQYWKSKYLIDWSSQSTKQENTFKKKFAIQEGFGQYVGLDQLIEGYGERSFYATWKIDDSVNKNFKD